MNQMNEPTKARKHNVIWKAKALVACGVMLLVVLLTISVAMGRPMDIESTETIQYPLDVKCCLLGSETNSRSQGPVSFMFGVINDDGAHFADEWVRGVRATTLELQWKLYEPQEGVYDTAYINHLKGVLRLLKDQGWYVQLIPGYHYTPKWVYTNYPDMYYVNQYGENYDPDPVTKGDFRVINAPFNPQARSLISRYVDQIFLDFDQRDPGLRFDSVRVGGGLQGELRYPPGNWKGQTNSYWAFDAHAQDPAKSGIPSMVVGWRPGIDTNPGSLGRGQLLVNPGFEDSYPFYPIVAWTPDDEVVAQRTSVQPHGGSYALSLTIDSPNRIHQFVYVQPNTTYQYGGWLKSNDGIGQGRMILNQYDADVQEVTGAPFGKLESNDKTWAYRSGTLTTDPQTRFLKVALDGDQNGTFLFDDVWLEQDGETDHRSRNIDVPTAFYDWYVQSLTDYQNWQINQIRQHFAGQLDIVYAGKGLQTKQITAALTNDLRGTGWSEGSRALYSGTAYARHVGNLNTSDVIALYLTGVDEPADSEVNDQSIYPSDWSPAHWIAHLARSNDLLAWGENSGQDNRTKLDLSVKRMQANNFIGLMWGFESELYANPNPNDYATINDYQAVIEYFANLKGVSLPLLFAP